MDDVPMEQSLGRGHGHGRRFVGHVGGNGREKRWGVDPGNDGHTRLETEEGKERQTSVLIENYRRVGRQGLLQLLPECSNGRRAYCHSLRAHVVVLHHTLKRRVESIAHAAPVLVYVHEDELEMESE